MSPLKMGDPRKTHPLMKFHLSVFRVVVFAERTCWGFFFSAFWGSPSSTQSFTIPKPFKKKTCTWSCKTPSCIFGGASSNIYGKLWWQERQPNLFYKIHGEGSSFKQIFSSFLLESLQLFSMFLLFILSDRPRTEASQCHHWLSTLPEFGKW